MFLMLTRVAKKIVNTMKKTKEPTIYEQEGVDVDLIMIQEEYLKNAPSVN